MAEQLEERDTQLRDQRLAVVASQEELDRLRQEITALRRANETAAQPDTTLLEIDTRGYIDYYLEEAGWVHGHSCTHQHEVQGMPNATGTGYVDDVLWGDDGKPLALVEAKRTSRDPMEGQRQAELYANGLEQRYGQRPLIFLSNGYRHRLWDDLRYPPREVQGFYKKDELETLIRRREIRQSLAQVTLRTALPGATTSSGRSGRSANRWRRGASRRCWCRPPAPVRPARLSPSPSCSPAATGSSGCCSSPIELPWCCRPSAPSAASCPIAHQ